MKISNFRSEISNLPVLPILPIHVYVLTALVASLLACVPAGEARAQYSSAPMPSWYDHGVMRQQTLNGWSVRDRLRRRGQQRQQSQAPQKQQRTTTTPAQQQQQQGGTTFRPVAASILPERLAARTKPAHRQEALRFYDNILRAYADIARRKGAPVNDVARAASFAAISFYSVYHDGLSLSEGQMEAVRRQMREAFSGDERFQRLEAARKQEIYETFVIQAMFVNSVYEGAARERDGRKVAEMKEIAREGLEGMFGVRADEVRVTGDGLELP